VSDPFLLVQLSDPHVGADWIDADPLALLADAVGSVLAMAQQPDAVVVSGDLTDHGADVECEAVRETLAILDVPIHVLPGNHDLREPIRRCFELPGHADEPIQYAVDLGPLRLVVLDTTIPGEDAGALDAERLGWLDAALAQEPDALTVIAMHHPPLVSGVPAFDRIALARPDQRALGEVVARHPQVERFVAGHVHRVMAAQLAGRAVLTVPSTYVQTQLDFSLEEIELADEPAGFGVHAVRDGELSSHVQPVIPT
jgi:3',5'-cyclic AMP phosphodiesterase CpdA